MSVEGPNVDDPEAMPELMARLEDPAAWVEPPEGFDDSAIAALRNARDQAEPVPIRQASAGQRRRPGVGWVLAAAAAVTVFAAGVLVWSQLVDQPDSSLELAGTDLAANASALVEIEEKPSGFEVRLDIEGLPPASEGTYYQAWFKSDEDLLVTIGTFHARGSGQDIVLWSGVDPADFALLTVTLQRVGDGAESSGRVVLTGSLDE